MSLTISVNNPAPTELSSFVVGDHASGTIADGTYSFLWVAWYTVAETDDDNAGYKIIAPSEWENVVVSGKNDTGTVTADLTVPVNSIPVNVYPDHYAVYCQSGTSWTYGSSSTRAAVMTANNTATTIYTTGTIEITWAAAHSSATLDPIIHMGHETREQYVKTFDGSVVKRSWAFINPLQSLSIQFPFMGINEGDPRAVMGDILKWITYGVTVSVTDDDADSFIEKYHGILIDCNYLNQKQKTSLANIELKMAVENCTINT